MHFNCLANCCAVHEICNLHDHTNPKAAFDHVIKQFGIKEYSLPAFFVFTGVVRCNHTASEYCPHKNNLTYGPKFAAFIKTNRLGTVTQSPARVNRASTKDHVDQVWVWSPSIRGIETYLAKTKTKVKTAASKYKQTVSLA